MIDELKRLRVWFILAVAVAAFVPIYGLMHNDDAIDFIASLCAVTAISVEIFYGTAFAKILKREAGEMTENHHFLLLGILIVAFSTFGIRSYGLWWRMWGRGVNYTPDGWFPAFMAYLAFIGYLCHIAAPRTSPEGVPKGGRMRVLAVLVVGGLVGLWFSVYN